jgi:hypothetical protein
VADLDPCSLASRPTTAAMRLWDVMYIVSQETPRIVGHQTQSANKPATTYLLHPSSAFQHAFLSVPVVPVHNFASQQVIRAHSCPLTCLPIELIVFKLPVSLDVLSHLMAHWKPCTQACPALHPRPGSA